MSLCVGLFSSRKQTDAAGSRELFALARDETVLVTAAAFYLQLIFKVHR